MSVVRQTIIERGVRSKQPNEGIKPIAPAIKVQHDQEKQELSHLNDRLSNYIERIKFLEGSNKKLLGELDHLRNTWGQETRNVIDKHEPELLKSRSKVDELSRDAAKAAIRAKRVDYELGILQRHYDDELNASAEDQKKKKNLEYLLEQNRNELELLKGRIGERERDIDKSKKENERLNADLKALLNDLDEEMLKCLQLRNENQTLEEQIPFLNAIHEQEVAEMKFLSSGANINPAQFYRHELERAIRDIRHDFEQLNELEKRELDAWYKIKTEEIAQLVAKREGLDDLSTVINQNNNLRSNVNGNNNELADLQQRQNELMQRLNQLHDALEDLRRNNAIAIDQRDREIADLKNKLQELLSDYDQLLHNKTNIEFEINTYRRLLDSNGIKDAPPPPKQELSIDELLQRLERERAKTGDVRISLAWDNINDLDLHVIEPSGEEVSFSHRKSATGGELDIDMNAGSQRNDKPVENIFWPKGNAPKGHYKVLVVYYSNHGGNDPTNFLVLADFYGKRKEFRGKMTYGDKPVVWEFDV